MLTIPAPPGRSAEGSPYRENPAHVARSLSVDPRVGLSDEEVESHLTAHGANELAATPRVPAWRRLLAQFTDLLILILIGAAVVAFVCRAS